MQNTMTRFTLMTLLGLTYGCATKVNIVDNSEHRPELLTYSLEKTLLSTAGSELIEARLWASCVRNSQLSLEEDAVALMVAFEAPDHLSFWQTPVTLAFDGKAHRFSRPYYNDGIPYRDKILNIPYQDKMLKVTGVDLPFPLFKSLANAHTASITIGDQRLKLLDEDLQGLRDLARILQDSR